MPLWKDKLELEVEEAELRGQQLLGDLPAGVKWLFVLFVLGIFPGFLVTRSLAKSAYATRYGALAVSAKASFAATEAKALELGKVQLTTTGSSIYAAGVKVKNPNLDLALVSVPFSIEFLSPDGAVAYTYRDTFTVLPNQSRYLVAPRAAVGSALSSARLVLPEQLSWQKRAEIPNVRLVASTPRLSQQIDPPAFVLETSVTNESPYLLGRVRTAVVLYDRSGAVVGVSQRDEFSVAPHEPRNIKLLWPGVSGAAVARAEVFPDTDVLDPKNLTIVSAPGSGDLSRPGTDSGF